MWRGTGIPAALLRATSSARVRRLMDRLSQSSPVVSRRRTAGGDWLAGMEVMIAAFHASLTRLLYLRKSPEVVTSTTEVPMPTFAERLREWRAHRGISQRGLDDAMNRKRSFTSNIEGGLVKPPDQATCLQLGEVLGVPGHVVWQAARSERLHSLDEELWRFYEGDTGVAALDVDGSPKTLTPEQDDLLEYLAWLDEDFPAEDGTCLAEHLSLAALTIFVEAEAGPGRKPSALAKRFVACVRRFSALPAKQQRGLLKLFVVACETVSESAR